MKMKNLIFCVAMNDEFYIGYCTYRCRCDGDE